jgi:hypothetical protein
MFQLDGNISEEGGEDPKSGPPRNPIRGAKSAPRMDGPYKSKRDPSSARPDAPHFGAEEKVGSLRSG